jgi:hypothetical protein
MVTVESAMLVGDGCQMASGEQAGKPINQGPAVKGAYT